MTNHEDSSTTSTRKSASNRISIGVSGIDEILHGGLIPTRSTLLRGPPGAGKTLLGLHYLTAGIKNGDTSLFINMGEPEHYLHEDATAFGFDIDTIKFLHLTPEKEDFHAGETYDVFTTAEVEAPEIAEEISETVQRLDPDRVFIDPISQLRYLIDDPYKFRKQVMAFLRYLEDTTVVFTSQATQAAPDDDLQFLADAIIDLHHDDQRRTLSVSKLRGGDFHRGVHSMRITGNGIIAFPELDPPVHHVEFDPDILSSGIPELDSMFHGGLEAGSVTMLSGPTGVGKTTIGLRFLIEGANQGDRSVLYSFEESSRTLIARAKALGFPIEERLNDDTLDIVEIGAGEMTVDEFCHHIRGDIEDHGAESVMIDAIGGFQHSLLGVSVERDVEILTEYLRKMGVNAIITSEVHRVTGEFHVTEESVSHLADNIAFLRHIEHLGELRKVIGVLKKRTSDYERTLRELQITEDGLIVGEPLPGLRGILTGTPEWDGETADSRFSNIHDDGS